MMLNSIIVPVHNEGHILSKTLASLAEAAAAAAGHRFELVIIRDNADAQTKSVAQAYDYSAFDSVRILDTAFGSAGLARNAGISAAKGDFIFFLDGDDLISYNYFSKIIAARDKQQDSRKIYFPEFYCGFGAKDYIAKFEDMETASPLMMFSYHIFGSTIAADRDILLNIPQRDIPVSAGYAYEDWHHNLELLAHGCSFAIVPDIIMFYRKRKNAGVHASSLVLSIKLPPASLYHRPDIYVQLCRADYNKYRFAKQIETPDAKQIQKRALELSGLFSRAHAIEPLINKTGKIKYAQSAIRSAVQRMPAALTYFEICDIIKGLQFDHIFLIPSLAETVAGDYILNIIREMDAHFPLSRVLILACEPCSGEAAYERLPPNAVFIDLSLMGLGDIADNCLLALRVIETASSENAAIKIHLAPCSCVSRFLKLYHAVLHDKNLILY